METGCRSSGPGVPALLWGIPLAVRLPAVGRARLHGGGLALVARHRDLQGPSGPWWRRSQAPTQEWPRSFH